MIYNQLDYTWKCLWVYISTKVALKKKKKELCI